MSNLKDVTVILTQVWGLLSFLNISTKQKWHYNQSCRYCFGARFGLAIGMVYFGTDQYRRFVLGLPLYIFTYLYVYSSKSIIC
jgi:hypothetical protein